MILGFFVGFFGHSFHYVVESWQNTPRQIELLARYAFGAQLFNITDCFTAWRSGGLQAATNRFKHNSALWTMIGLGVWCGHMLGDYLERRGKC